MSDLIRLRAVRETAPIPPIYLVSAIAISLGLVISGLAALSPSHARLAAGGMALAVIVAGLPLVVLLGWRIGLMVLLIVTCLVDRDVFPTGSFDIRPEQIAALLALAVFAGVGLRNHQLAWRPNLAELALGGWFVIGLASSILVAPDRGHSVKILALLVVSSLGLLLPRRLLGADRDGFEQVVGWALLALAAESAYACVAYVLHVFGPTISIGRNPATNHLNAYGTLWEPNVLGAISAAGAVLWIFLGPRYFKHPWLGVALCLTASIASYTRAAWIAVAMVVVLMIALPLRRRIDLRFLSVGAMAATIMIIVILSADRVGNYSSGGPVSGVGNQTDVIGRLAQISPALNDLKHHLLIGGGTDSFGERHILDGLHTHLTALALLVANDTGLMGILVFLAFVAVIIVAAWRARKDLWVVGLGVMLVLLAITNQSTETSELMITWLLAGVLLAGIDVAHPVSAPETSRSAKGTGS